MSGMNDITDGMCKRKPIDKIELSDRWSWFVDRRTISECTEWDERDRMVTNDEETD